MRFQKNESLIYLLFKILPFCTDKSYESYTINFYIFKDGWLDAEELGCFKFLETDTDLVWVEAQQKCESIGGYLAEPTTARSTITH